jgi:phenylalanyl-tRNA synthetase beta chain
MTILTLNRKKLEEKIGKINPEMENRISMFGTPVEELTDTEISVDITPNRPDLLSFSGFTRAILGFLGKNTGLKEYKVEEPSPDYKVIIEKTVKKVRPYTACAIVKNLKFDDDKIKEIIDLQEKLHGSYGRNRKKIAIGIYPLEKIKPPIKFLGRKPEEIKFIPLEGNKEMNGKQILSQHPTGREYGYLLEGCDVYPIFEDANKEILSMPPIINSEKTGKISEETKEIFIECSGFHLDYLKKTLNMIVCSLADMGGKIYAMEIQDNKKYLSPDLSFEKMQFSIEDLNKTLGLELSEKEIKKYLEKMGIGYVNEKDKSFALIPPYRTDIIHEIDLTEEVAIAYGYENFKPEIPNISIIGEEDKTEILKRKISEVLIGLGILEVSTYHLSTKDTQFKKMGFKEFKSNDLIEIIDSKTENNILRTSLLGNSIQVLSQNSDASYPQKIFELGVVFNNNEKKETKIEEKEKLCVSLCHEKANFTEIKQVFDYLTKMFEINYELKDIEHPSFIKGRCGEIIINNNSIGVIGEIAPFVLKNSKIKMPVASFEIDINEFIKP